MANNRYFMLCKCGSTHYLGKSLGGGIYNNATASGVNNSWTIDRREGTPILQPAPTNEPQGSGYARFLESVYEWMWEHLTECVGDEWAHGEIFKVITEYDDELRAALGAGVTDGQIITDWAVTLINGIKEREAWFQDGVFSEVWGHLLKNCAVGVANYLLYGPRVEVTDETREAK